MIISCPACATRYNIDPAVLGEEGRRVRCANCGHSWIQAAPSVDVDDVDMPNSFNEPLDVGDAPETGDDFDLQAEAEAGLGNLDSLSTGDDGSRGAGFPTAWVVAAILVIAMAVSSYFAADRIAAVVGDPVGSALVNTKSFIDRQVAGLFGGAADPDAGTGTGQQAQPGSSANPGSAEIGDALIITQPDLQTSEEVRGSQTVLIVRIRGEIVNESDEARALQPLRAYLIDDSGRELTSWPVRPKETFLAPRQRTSYETRLENPDPAGVEIEIKFAAQ